VPGIQLFWTNYAAMQTLYQSALFIHILAGGVALLSGLTALLLRKFTPNHPKAGRVFFVSTLLVAVTAILMAALKPNTFLLLIGVFTFYQTYAGFRSVQDKSLRPTGLDLLVWLAGAVNGVAMLMQGELVLWVFGGIQAGLVLNDLRTYLTLWRGKALPPKAWLRRHLGMMLGAFIAVITAFVIVNTDGYWWQWIGPTLVLSPLIVYWNIRLTSKNPKPALIIGALCLLLAAQPLLAQPYVEGGKTRHRFAQLNLGTDFGVLPAGNTRSWAQQTDGSWANTGLPAQSMTRLIVGGTHFWGHADFFIAFPVWQQQSQGYRERVESGFRFFPWRIEQSKIRPYAGFSHRALVFSAGDGADKKTHRLPLSAGVYFNRGSHLFDLGISYTHWNTIDYPFENAAGRSVQLPQMGFRVGYKYMLETTLSAEKNWLNGRTARLTDTLAKMGRLNGLTVGIGPSVAFFLKASPELAANYPGLTQHKIGNIFPELMLGYYWHKPDVQLSAVYRSYQSGLSAYGFEQQLQRRALTLEAYRFTGDYHGFVPFFGPALSWERWSAATSRNGQSVAEGQANMLRAGLTAGWDIRPDRLQAFYLRTVVRWFPGKNLGMSDGTTLSLDQLEVNFIQLVILPGRW